MTNAKDAEPVATREFGLPEGLVTVSQHRSGGPPADHQPASDWLLARAARTEDARHLLDELCWRLNTDGIAISRSTLHIGTLHPQLRAHAVRWWRAEMIVEEVAVLHGIEDTGAYRDSPVPLVMGEGRTIRRRLDHDTVREFPVLDEIRARGGTDYLALPLTFSTGHSQCLTFATDRAGGFPDEHVVRLISLAPLLALLFEVHATKRMMRELLGIYLGRGAGGRVLDGAVRRGAVQRIRAAILVADMRGFSALSAALPPEAVIASLNDFFAALVEPIEARGGEVLKFIGDGLIAVFPFEGTCTPASPAECALIAAQQAMAGLDRLNRDRAARGEVTLLAGIALHVGEVVFGNVGAPDRLDFTAIGPAVNLASHLEAFNKAFDCRLVASREFAGMCATPLALLGKRHVPDQPGPCEIYGLPRGCDASA